MLFSLNFYSITNNHATLCRKVFIHLALSKVRTMYKNTLFFNLLV